MAPVLHCRFCDDKFTGVVSYISHLRCHRHVNSTFPCGVESCSTIRSSETSLRTHLIRCHQLFGSVRASLPDRNRSLPLNAQCKYLCSILSCRAEFDSFKGLMKHLANHIVTGRTVKCPFPDCHKAYNVHGSLTGHVSKRHRHMEDILLCPPNDSDDDPNDMAPFVSCEEVADEADEIVVGDGQQCVQRDGQAWIRALSDFFLRLQMKYLIPARTVQYIATEMRHLHDNATRNLSDIFNSSSNDESSLKSDFKDWMASFDFAYQTLSTSKRRLTFYMNHYLFVAPQKIPLGEPGKNNFFYYVSIKATLQKIMMGKSRSFIDLDPPAPSPPGLLRGFMDGLVYRNNAFFAQNQKAFRIILYQDGFEIVCPIGPAKRKYKLIGVYMSLGNLPDHLRTHPDTIQLVALCKEKELNHEKVFGRIADELGEIEREGVHIEGHGQIKGSLVYVSGDNLGSHGIGGFNENFSKSNHFCRYCLISRLSFLAPDGHILEHPKRTPENYEVALTGRLPRHRYGVKFNSALNRLMHFHVCNPGLPPCLGHDLLEGLGAYDAALMLHYFMDCEWFTLENLNDKIQSFPYSTRDRRDQPLPFDQEYSAVKGNMWQIYNAIRLFPIMLTEFVEDAQDQVWRMFLLLGEILDILCAPALHESWVGYLQAKVLEYLHMRKTLFPNIPLRPKHHYLLHYCEMILYFGPLGKVWTLRFECKHCFFKNCIRSSKNFINVMHSCCHRHEMFQAFLRAGGDFRSLCKISKSSAFDRAMYAEEIVTAISTAVPLVSLRQCEKAEFKGTRYNKGDILALPQPAGVHEVSLGRVLLIVFHDEDAILFLIEKLETTFISEARAYQVGAREGLMCIPQTDLQCYSPMYTYNFQGHLWVKLKHALVMTNADAVSFDL